MIGCDDSDDMVTGDLGAASCSTDAECSDSIFCNGSERCDPDNPGASAFGCMPGTAPCSRECNEEANRCETDCDEPDADGDGAEAIECGGEDCDDADPNRFPGNTEVCDPDDIDEDCDPTTFGDTDMDEDGHVDGACCNLVAGGADALCGDDCDDTNAGVHFGLAETCDELDNDCDGAIDETTGTECWTDADNDGFAPADATTTIVCGDCGSNLTGVAPVNDAVTDCNDDPGMGGASVAPGQSETCNDVDDDCDGSTDEGVLTVCFVDADEDGWVPAGASTMEVCGPCPSGSTDTPRSGDDCDDTMATVHPSAVEACDGFDSDCSEGGGTVAAEDMDGDGQAATDASCAETPTSFPKSDCNDDSNLVFEGQTEYFADPLCPAGYTTCECGTAPALPGCRPLAIPLPPCDCDSFWDYDCSGANELEPESFCPDCGIGDVVCSGGDFLAYPDDARCGGDVVSVGSCSTSLCQSFGPECPANVTSTTEPLRCR